MSDPRAEAAAAVDHRYEVRVLEPAPPAAAAWSDDPTDRSEVPAGRPLVSPVTDGDRTWADLVADDPALAPFCSPRWLAAYRPLVALPDGWQRTRDDWHALAEHVVAPARHAATGRIGLRWTRAGFGTPYFGADDRQVRVAAGDLVVESESAPARVAITTLAAAAATAGIEPGAPTEVFAPLTALDPDRRLTIDPAAAAALADWFGLATSALAQLRVAHRTAAPSLVQLWPEHFDIAVDLGDADAGTRANYGASPGDAEHPEPYLYVGPWERERAAADPWFADLRFPGASLPYAELLTVADARGAALDFFAEGVARLLPGGSGSA